MSKITLLVAAKTSATSAFFGDKASALLEVANELVFALFQLSAYNQSTPSDNLKLVFAANGKRGTTLQGIMYDAFKLCPNFVKDVSKADKIAFYENIVTLTEESILNALSVAFPDRAVKTEQEKATAKTAKEKAFSEKAIEHAKGLGMIAAADLPKSLTLKEYLAQMTKGELIDAQMFIASQIAVFDSIEAEALENLRKTGLSDNAEKTNALVKDANARKANAKNIGKKQVKESPTLQVA